MTPVADLSEMPAEKALDIARSVATTGREIARKTEEDLAEALTRYNQAGGEHAV